MKHFFRQIFEKYSNFKFQ